MVERAPYKGVTVVQLHLGGRRGTMKTDKFLKRFRLKWEAKKSDVAIFPQWSGLHISWDLYKQLAKATEMVNFKCEFDERGICINRRPYADQLYYKKHPRQLQMCCCSGCYYELGYQRTLQKDERIINRLARHFDDGREKKGYWRPKRGCILPRELRTTTCLSHYCRAASSEGKLSEAENILLTVIRNGPKSICGIKFKDDIKSGKTVEDIIHKIIDNVREEKNGGLREEGEAS